MAEYKQCPNGHYYQGDKCPFCKPNAGGNSGSNKTEVYGGGFSANNTGEPAPNETMAAGGNHTQISEPVYQPSNNQAPYVPASHTVFGDEEAMASGRHSGNNDSGFRTTRKLVGWLVSYTLDPMGVAFNLYEGRNIIGRDMDCSITINDNMVSGKHAVLLFRSGKYSITDSQSTHGTFVNDNDIDLEPCYLQDGDIIRIGNSILKFRTSF